MLDDWVRELPTVGLRTDRCSSNRNRPVTELRVAAALRA